MGKHEKKIKHQKKLVHKNIEDMQHELNHKQDIFSRLDIIIYNQNKILLRDIANRYKWSYRELCEALLEKPKK
jgi:flagellin-specific chaperone FliS